MTHKNDLAHALQHDAVFIGADPGVHHTGIAVVTPDRVVLAAELVRHRWKNRTVVFGAGRSAQSRPGPPTAPTSRIFDACIAIPNADASRTQGVVERPHIRYNDPSDAKIDHGDLIDVGIVAGYWLGAFQLVGIQAAFVYPRDWKGRVKKAVTQARLERDLSDACKAKVYEAAPPSLRHNVWDAVGIAMWGATGRR